MTSAAVVLVVVAPLLASVAVTLSGHREPRAAPLLGVAGTGVAWLSALALASTHWGDAAPATVGTATVNTGGLPISFVLRVDQLSAAMVVLATTVALLVQIYSVAYLRGDPRYPSYASFVCLFTSAMALVVTADDLFVLLVGWEVMGACSYFLIGHHWELEPARAGALKAFVMTRLGDIGLLFGIFVVGSAAGTYRISGVVEAARTGGITASSATVACLLLLCGVVGKSAQFPLHSWLPDAMPGPTPISALIHAATMVAAGVFLVARLLPLFELSGVAMTVLTVISVVTMLGAAAFALAADDLKRVLAWSTVSQLALMFSALSLGGYAAGVLHLLSHGAFKALLFLAAGSVIHAVGTQRVGGMGGLRSSMPWTFATMTVGFAALAGVPPLVGFFSKDAVLTVAVDEAMHGQPVRGAAVLVAGLVTTAVTAAYCARTWLLVFFGPRRHPATAPVTESPTTMVAPLVVLAVATVAGGAAVLDPAFLAVESEPLAATTLAVSTFVVAAGAGLAMVGWVRLDRTDPALLLGRARPWLARELGYDDLLARVVVRPTWRASKVTALNESEVVDAYVRGTGAGTQWSARLLRWLHDGDVQRYVTAIVVGAVAVAVVVGVVQ